MAKKAKRPHKAPVAAASGGVGEAGLVGKRKLRPAVAVAGSRPKRAKAKAKSSRASVPARLADGAALVAEALRGVAPKVVAGRKGPRRLSRLPPLERLEFAIDEVRLGARSSPRTRKLQTSGIPKMAQKLIEEAAEVAIEAVQGNRVPLVNESVDLLYNMLVLLSASGVTLEMLWAEMERRELALGMAEKLPKVVDADG